LSETRIRRFRRAVYRITHWLLYLIAGLMVFFAVVLTATRAMTPLLTMHKARFEQWVSHAMELPVKVDEVKFGWSGFQPEVWLSGVTVYQNAPAKQPLGHIDNLYVSLDVFRTVLSRELRLGVITFSGFRLRIDQLKHGYRVNQAMSVSLEPGAQSSVSDFFKDLLRRAYVRLSNVSVQYHAQNKKTTDVYIRTLVLNNASDAYQLSGSARLTRPGIDKPFSVNFITENKGGLFDYHHATGKLYAKVTGLDLGAWFKAQEYHGYWFNAGQLNSKVWLRFHQGHLDSVSLSPKVYNLSLHSQRSGRWLRIKSLQGLFAFKRRENGAWEMSANNLDIITKDSVWPTLNFYLAKDATHHRLAVWLNYLDLQDTLRWLSGSTLVPAKIGHLLYHYQPRGALNNAMAFINLDNAKEYYFQAYLNDLGLDHLPSVGAVDHLSGAIYALPGQGAFRLDSKNLSLDLSGLFDKPVDLSLAKGLLRWRYGDQGFKVSGYHLHLANPDISWVGDFAVEQKAKKPVMMSLMGGYYMQSPTQAAHYLPTRVMEKGAVDWLSQAFISGAPLTGKIVIHGPLNDFPFLDKRGIFQVDTNIQNMHLHYADGWPDLTGLNANLLFSDNRMTVNASSATVLGAKVSNLQGTIPSLTGKAPDQLLVDANIDDKASDILRFFNQSPLKETVGASLENMRMQGDTLTKLHLTIPLSDPDKTQVQGETQFLGVDLHLLDWRLWVKELKGRLSFTASSIASQGLQGILEGKPVNIHIKTQQKPYLATQVNFSSSLSVSKIFAYFGLKQPSFISGDFGFKAKLNLPDVLTSLRKNELRIESDLSGVSLALPQPLGKAAQDSVDSEFNVSFAGTSPGVLNFHYGDRLAAAFSFIPSQQGAKLYSGQLTFGANKTVAPVEPSLLLTGVLDHFNWLDWKTLWSKEPSNFSSAKSSESDFISRFHPTMDVLVKTLALPVYTFKNARVTAKHESAGWRVGLSNPVLAGDVLYPSNYPESPLLINLSSIDLSALLGGMKKGEAPGSPLQWLWLQASVARLRYQNLEVTGIKADLKPESDALLINRLSASGDLLNGSLTGRVTYQKGKPLESSIRGSAGSNNFTLLLKTFGLRSSLLAKKAQITFDLSWPKGLADFELSQLNGDMNMRLVDGWLVDLGQSTTQKLNLGKLVTLLSLRHLLTLNVSDLGKDGYHFDSLTGALHFDHGRLSSNNLEALGQVADIKAKGWVDLVKKTLSLEVGVDTNLGASLPVIATIAGGPVIGPIAGIATWAVDKLVHSATRESSRYDYRITGPWSKPKVQHLGATAQ